MSRPRKNKTLRNLTLSLAGAFTCAAGAVPAAADIQTAPAANTNTILSAAHGSQRQEVLIRSAASNCVNNSDPLLLIAAPPLKAMFDQIAAQPLTGADLARAMTDPVNRFQSCADSSLNGQTGILAAYVSAHRRLILPASSLQLIHVAHESYHAYQHANGALSLMHGNSPLSYRDQMTATLITEATAAAYVYVLLREMAFTNPAPYEEYKKSTHTFGMAATFDAAFDAAYAAHAATDETARRAAALQAGGQAVVRSLLSNGSPGWRAGYAQRAVNVYSLGDANADVTSRDYLRTRDAVYGALGKVGGQINLTPPELLGPQAASAIDSVIQKSGIEIASPQVPNLDFTRRPAQGR